MRIGSDFIVFFQRLWSDWLARITGPIGLALAVVALFRPVDAWLFTIAGMLCVVLAAYRVWRVEYEHRHEVAFPDVQYPGGAYQFHIQRPVQRQRYIAATDITFTNRSVDRHVSIGVYLQVNHGLGTLLMYAPDNDPIANWREAAMLNDRPNSTQLMFPLNLAPKTSAGGHILFFIDDKERSIVGDDTFPKVKHLEVEELSSHEKRLYPVTATLECDARGTRLV